MRSPAPPSSAVPASSSYTAAAREPNEAPHDEPNEHNPRIARNTQPAAFPDDEDGGPTPPIGRPRHVIDRALEYLALARKGWRPRDIARRRRRSKGYVSILLRLGTAVDGLTELELQVLRSKRVTWKLVQRIVRRDVSVLTIREQLRLAIGGFSRHNVDRRKYRGPRAGRRHDDAPRASRASNERAWVEWDDARAAGDPVAYCDWYIDQLVAAHREFGSRLRLVLTAPAPNADVSGVPLVGQSLVALVAAAKAAAGASGNPRALSSLAVERQRALRALAQLDAFFRSLEHRSAEESWPGSLSSRTE